jgi:hypothetical protein
LNNDPCVFLPQIAGEILLTCYGHVVLAGYSIVINCKMSRLQR